LAADGVKALLRLYPRSWRKRYGGEIRACGPNQQIQDDANFCRQLIDQGIGLASSQF